MTTREQIKGFISLWMPRLGLDHWEIKVDWNTPAGPDNDAEYVREDWYDIATLKFREGFERWSPAFAERVVVHELMHLVTRDLDGTVSMAYEQLPAATRRLAEKHYERAIEGVVERVATALVGVASSTDL